MAPVRLPRLPGPAGAGPGRCSRAACRRRCSTTCWSRPAPRRTAPRPAPRPAAPAPRSATLQAQARHRAAGRRGAEAPGLAVDPGETASRNGAGRRGTPASRSTSDRPAASSLPSEPIWSSVSRRLGHPGHELQAAEHPPARPRAAPTRRRRPAAKWPPRPAARPAARGAAPPRCPARPPARRSARRGRGSPPGPGPVGTVELSGLDSAQATASAAATEPSSAHSVEASRSPKPIAAASGHRPRVEAAAVGGEVLRLLGVRVVPGLPPRQAAAVDGHLHGRGEQAPGEDAGEGEQQGVRLAHVQPHQLGRRSLRSRRRRPARRRSRR